jgi:hypothetical protein
MDTIDAFWQHSQDIQAPDFIMYIMDVINVSGYIGKIQRHYVTIWTY